MDDLARIESYIAGLPEPQGALLARVRAVIRAACPDASEVIAYGMPGFRFRGRLLFSYAAHKGHCSIYPASGMVAEALGAELAPFVAHKATIRFTAAQPLPDDLLRRLVAVRVAENAAATG
jgi:uncharacterized protein YdhG (YjbR/CyaY superfamily)